MDTVNSVQNNTAVNKITTYSLPGSPISETMASNAAGSNDANHSPDIVGPSMTATAAASSSDERLPTTPPVMGALSTPKKDVRMAAMLQTIREKLLTPGGACELHALGITEHTDGSDQGVKLIKDRYLISAQPSQISAAAAAKTPASYRHLIDLTSSNLKCVDVFSSEQFLCKIINEPLDKVQGAYFKLKQDEDLCRSTIYGHKLIREAHDIVPMSKDRTYIVVAPVQNKRDSVGGVTGIYENLHTYIRHEKRLCETEARAIFHQICQTVQVCHRNGIILRDLKLKRFYFIDEARTKLQYESLEGSMILDDINDDTLSDKIGCPLYTAPELLCPQPTYQGKPADMWSLGVILYTMLVGQYPFYEKANCNLITIIRHGNVQIPMSLSKSVRSLLLSLLRKNYKERMTATHIFLAPWLKEQRPFYMYLPVNVEIAEDWDNEDDEHEATAMDEDETELCHLGYKHAYDDIGVEPLDYTRSTLQMAQSTEVDMG